MSELKLITSKSKAAVISITETWLDSSITDGEIHIDNYSVLRRDRTVFAFISEMTLLYFQIRYSNGQ